MPSELWIVVLPLVVFAALFLFRRRASPGEGGGCCAGKERNAGDSSPGQPVR
jgi:hypothetical protein